MAEDGGNSMPENDAPPADAAPAADPSAERTFTQKDVDRLMKHRLAEEVQRHYGDYDDLKQKAARLDEIEQQNMSDLEREREARAAAEQRLQQLDTEIRQQRLRSALLAEAAKADRKIVSPEDAIALLDASTLELGDDGAPLNADKALDALIEAKPWLVASAAARGTADQGARNHGVSQLTRDDLKSMSPEQIVAAQKDGRLAQLQGSSS